MFCLVLIQPPRLKRSPRLLERREAGGEGCEAIVVIDESACTKQQTPIQCKTFPSRQGLAISLDSGIPTTVVRDGQKSKSLTLSAPGEYRSSNPESKDMTADVFKTVMTAELKDYLIRESNKVRSPFNSLAVRLSLSRTSWEVLPTDEIRQRVRAALFL